MIISVFDRVENVGKAKNVSYQHFLLFLQCLKKASFPDTSKGVILLEWVKPSQTLSDYGYMKSILVQQMTES